MFLVWLALATLARAEFTIPPLTGPVVDQAHILSPAAKGQLDAYLINIHDQGGAQIQVVTLPDLGGLPIEQASIAITDQWKLGKKKEDRGVLFLIAASEHKLRIEVGQGLEGNLPDAIANRIINEIVVPRFKAGEVDQGVFEGVKAIVHSTDPNLENAPVFRRHAAKNGAGRLVGLLFWVLIVLIFLRPGGRGGMGGLITYGLLGGLGGGGGWGSGDSGGGSWSGGGGGFSGGGSSGSW